MQHTLKTTIALEGTGLHSGAPVTLTLRAANAGEGIVFVRTDLAGDNKIPALYDRVADTRLCTVIANSAGASVGTIEHLMAALRGCGIDNVICELNGPEVPIMDGSSEPFVRAIENAGTIEQTVARRAIRVLAPVTVEQDGKSATLLPAEEFIFAGEIEFDHPHIGRQRFETRLLNGNFKHDLADSRTFGFFHEVEQLRKMGLARGGSLDNAIVLDKDTVMNPGGLRHADEFIRHKLLDAVGDLYLAGMPILGAYEGFKAGHALNNQLLRAMFANPASFEIITLRDIAMPKAARTADALATA